MQELLIPALSVSPHPCVFCSLPHPCAEKVLGPFQTQSRHPLVFWPVFSPPSIFTAVRALASIGWAPLLSQAPGLGGEENATEQEEPLVRPLASEATVASSAAN